jgi:exonuclease SbcD
MRILHTADWHLGRALEGRSRMEEQTAFMDELTQIAEDEQIDLVLIAGDVYDSVNPPAAAEQLFYEAVSRLCAGGRRRVIAIAGNHDHPERLSASGPLAEQQGIALIGLPTPGVLTAYAAATGEQAVIFALPYPSESRLRELLADFPDEQLLRNAYSERVARIAAEQARHFSAKTVNLLMSHIYVLGGTESDSERPIQVGGAYTVDASALSVGAQYVALGHLHRPQTIRAEMPIRYCGSPLAYSFSEAGQAKSVTVIEASPGKPAHYKEVYLRSGKPLVRWHAKDGIAEVHRWLDEGKDRSAWIDLEIHMNESLSMEQIQSLRKLHGGIVNIRPVFPDFDKAEARTSASIGLPADEIFRRFYKRQTGGAVPDEQTVQLFMELLLESSESPEAGEEQE